MTQKIDINQPLPGWVSEHPVILQAAEKKSGGTGKYVFESFRKNVIRAGKNPLPKQITTLGVKAYRLLYGKIAA